MYQTVSTFIETVYSHLAKILLFLFPPSQKPELPQGIAHFVTYGQCMLDRLDVRIFL